MKKTRQKGIKTAFAGVCVVLTCVFVLKTSLPALRGWTERFALLSMVMSMPEGSIQALKERYESELYSSTPPPEETPKPPESAAPPITTEESKPEPESSSSQKPELPGPEDVAIEIPEEFKGALVAENLSGYKGGPYITFGAAYIRNYTKMTTEKIESILKKPQTVQLAETKEPQVLIVHTHATESYAPYDSAVYDTRYNWRSTDNNNNMVAVGEVLAKTLEEHGIGVLHDTTQHDYPSYNGSYMRSEETVKAYLKKYPSIKIVFDVHRDAIERDNHVIVKPTVEINGKKAAQLMVISCADDGTGNMPNWEENFKFAAAITDAVNSEYPDLMRPVFFCYRKYNQQLSTGSLLLEFGSHASTLEEAKYTARLAGEAIADLLNNKK